MNSLKKARMLSDKRQIDVYHITGIWPARLSMIENGLIKPRMHEIQKLANLYGVKTEDLLWDCQLKK